MKIFLPCACAVALFPIPLSAANDAPKMPSLAQEVWQVSGGQNWSKVKAIDFTFAVEKEGKKVAEATHHWDVTAQTDEVKWKGKDITVNLAEPATSEDAKAAYARWVNDSYWLLMPVKLRDPGVTIVSEGTKEMDGAKRDVLHLSFGQVGLTPNDQYRLYVDPKTMLVTHWDYMPKGEEGMSGTWSGYQKSGGLTLATDHQMNNGIRIRILDLKVTSAE